MAAKKQIPRDSIVTKDIHGVVYRKIAGAGNIVYHCSTDALGDPRPNEDVWQIIEEDTVTESLSPIIDSDGSGISYRFDHAINDTNDFVGAGTFLATHTYWN